jgi:hypothetical protein
LADHLAATVNDADASGFSVVVDTAAVEEGEIARVVLDVYPFVLREPGYGWLRLSAAGRSFLELVSGAYVADIHETDVVGEADGEALWVRIKAFHDRAKLLTRSV